MIISALIKYFKNVYIIIFHAYTAIAEVPRCPVGYVEGPPDSHCYLHVNISMTWEQAQEFCAANHSGAFLANVGSAQEDQFIHSLMAGNKRTLCYDLRVTV